jgi:hypothetical protein
MGDEEEGEIERKREKGEDEEGEWIESNNFLFTPLIPCVSLSLSLGSARQHLRQAGRKTG